MLVPASTHAKLTALTHVTLGSRAIAWPPGTWALGGLCRPARGLPAQYQAKAAFCSPTFTLDIMLGTKDGGPDLTSGHLGSDIGAPAASRTGGPGQQGCSLSAAAVGVRAPTWAQLRGRSLRISFPNCTLLTQLPSRCPKHPSENTVIQQKGLQRMPTFLLMALSRVPPQSSHGSWCF